MDNGAEINRGELINKTQRFSQWLKENGAGGKDEWLRPNLIAIPEQTGWLDWYRKNKSAAKIEPLGSISEPFTSWSPPDHLSDTQLIQKTIMPQLSDLLPSGIQRLLKPTVIDWKSDNPVYIHIHPSSPYTAEAGFLSPQDIGVLTSVNELEMVVAITQNQQVFAALKGPELVTGNDLKLWKTIERTTRKHLKSYASPDDIQMDLHAVNLNEKLFGEKSVYNIAFYAGKLGDPITLLRRFSSLGEDQHHLLKIKWKPIDEKDPKILTGPFSAYTNMHLGSFF